MLRNRDKRKMRKEKRAPTPQPPREDDARTIEELLARIGRERKRE